MINLFKIQNCFFWPVLLLANLFLQPVIVFAYYEVSETSRPPSAFSICCCKKETEESSQRVYSCKYEETSECPDGTREYNSATLGCPSDLVLTKYHSGENSNN